MTPRAVLGFALLTLLVSGCTADDAARSQADQTTKEATSESALEGASKTQERSADGPLSVDGEGRLCIDNRVNRMRDFTYGDDLLKTSEPIELEKVELVGARGIRLVEAWTFPSRGIPLLGSWSGWPLPRRALSHDRLDWDERTHAEGAQLDPSTPYNFLVRMRRQPGDNRQGFAAIRIEYRSADTSYMLDTRTKVSFQKRTCL